MKEKFILRIPLDQNNEESDFKELRFKTRKEVCEFLDITMNTFNSLMNDQLKFILPKVQHLKGIHIERIDDGIEKKKEHDIVDPEEYRKKLLEKMK